MNIFQEAKFHEVMQPLAEAKPLSKRRQEAAAWNAILSESAKSPREYILRAIARGAHLSRQDAIRYVFGSKLKERRSYLSQAGESFDLFIMCCMYDYYSDYRGQDVRTWEDELHDIISCVATRTEAKSLLIGQYLDTHGPFYREIRTVTYATSNPAF